MEGKNDKAQVCFFKCNHPCPSDYNASCRECNIVWHYACTENVHYKDRLKCIQCQKKMTNRIVAFWAMNTFNHASRPISTFQPIALKNTVDLNYIKDGAVVAVLPIVCVSVNSGVYEWMELRPFIACNISNKELKWVTENWYNVTTMMWSVAGNRSVLKSTFFL